MINISRCNSNNEVLSNILRMVKLIIPKANFNELYELNVDGIKKCLVKDNNSFYIVNIDEKLFSSIDVFAIDGNHNINCLKMHNTNIALNNGVVTVFDNNVLPDGELGDDADDFDYYEYFVGCVKKSLTISSIEEVNTRYANYNSVINYLEYNFDNALSLFYRCFFQAKFDGTDRINDAYLNMPFHINVVSLKSMDVCKEDEEYFLTEWYREHKNYMLALFKQKGFKCFLPSEENDFQFYYDKPVFDEEGNMRIWNMISSNMYNLDYLKNQIINKGFDFDIPQEMIDLYNGDSYDYQYCKNILEEYDKFILKKKN